MSNDRAKRLRNKRNEVKDKASEQNEESEAAEQSEASETSEPPKPDKTDETDEEESDGGEESVKEEHVGVYMYLPENQRDEVSYQFDRLKAEYKRVSGEELEKNRDFYPLLIKCGLDSLEGWDGEDVQDRLDDS